MNTYVEYAVMFVLFAIIVIMVVIPTLIWWADR